MKKRIMLSLITLIGIIGGYTFASKEAGTEDIQAIAQSIEEIQAEQGKPVQVETVRQQDIQITQTFYGSVIPYAEAKVQGKHGGTITFLKGKEGDRVKAGEVLVKFDTSDAQLQLQQAIAGKNSALQNVKQAQSNFETLQTTVNRYQELFKDGLIPRQNLDEMLNQLHVAQAGLGSAREQVKNSDAQIQLLQNTLNNMKITAPISGVIDENHFNLYEIAKPGEVIYHIVDIDRVYIEVDIPEAFISQIREQMQVQAAYDSLMGEQFHGSVERISPTGDPQLRNFSAKVLVNNPEHRIKPGMFSRVTVCLDEIPAALVFSKKALLKDEEGYYVFKIVGNLAKKIPVEITHRNGNTVAVLSNNLKPEDRVVVEGARLLNPNERVKVL